METKKTIVAIVLAPSLALALALASYALFPNGTPQPKLSYWVVSTQEPVLTQIFGAFLWIGLAAFIALVTVSLLLLIGRIKKRTL